MQTIDDKTIVREYFNSTGFDRWQRIYGDGEVNRVQLDIRTGHQKTVDTLLGWLQEDGNLAGLTICDAGCGVGSASIPLAAAGAIVSASDISEKMVGEAKTIAQKELGNDAKVDFQVADLATLTGEYHTVICLDVLIHYPEAEAAKTIANLAALAKSRVILSFAPKTPCLSLLKKIGSFFPGPSKATRAYLHRESAIVAAFEEAGFKIKRKSFAKTKFYFSLMLEAVKD